MPKYTHRSAMDDLDRVYAWLVDQDDDDAQAAAKDLSRVARFYYGLEHVATMNNGGMHPEANQ